MAKDWYLYLDRAVCAVDVVRESGVPYTSSAETFAVERVETHIAKQAVDLKAFGYEDGELVIRFNQVEVMPISVTFNTPVWRHLQAERRAKLAAEVANGD